jgi:hypothetical protein
MHLVKVLIGGNQILRLKLQQDLIAKTPYLGAAANRGK